MATVRDRLVLELGGQVQPSARETNRVLLGIISAGAAAAAALVAVTVRMTALGDEAAKSARGMDITAEAYQRLGVAAELAGVSQGSLTMAVSQGNQRLADAAHNGGRAAEAFGLIGISAGQAVAEGQTFADLLPSILDGLRGLPAAERALAGSEIFGRRRYAEFATLIEGGGEGLVAAYEEARVSGVVMSEETTRAAEGLTDAISMVGFRLRGLSVSLTSRLIPAFDRVIRAGLEMFDAISPTVFEALDLAAQGLATALDALLTPLGRVVSAIALVGGAIKAARLAMALPAVTAAVKGLTAALGPLLASVIPIVAPIALAALAVDDLLTYMDGGDSVIGRFAEAMGMDSALYSGFQSLQDIGSGVADLLKIGLVSAFDAAREAIRDMGPDLEWLGSWMDSIKGFFQDFSENFARGAAFVAEGVGALVDEAQGGEAFTDFEREQYGSATQAIAARAQRRLVEQAQARAVQQERIQASRGGGDGGAGAAPTVNVYGAQGQDPEAVGRGAVRELERRRRAGTATVAP